MRKVLVFAGLVVGAAYVAPAIAQTAGVVQFVAGEVRIVDRAGAERSARKGVPVSVGETLHTAPGGLAQLKMGDGAIVVVQPESRLTVAEFHYAGVEDGTEKVRYKLDHGGFRAVTGAIGRTHKKNYLIETPIAHMGVRGTDHESYYFPATGPVTPDGAKPGAYNKVNTGRTYIRTEAGEVEVQPNQVGYVASAGQVPEILVRVPGFFNHSIAPREARRPADADQGDEPNVIQTVQSENGVRLLRTRGPKVTPGTGNGPLVGYIIRPHFGGSGNGVNVTKKGTESTGTHSTLFGADINWSSWAGGKTLVDGNVTVGSTHFIETTDKANLAALPPTLTYGNYALVNGVGPAPTNEAGLTGAVTALDVGVDFSNQRIDSYNLTANAGGTEWTSTLKTNAPRTIADFTGAGGIRLEGSCTTCGGGMTAGTAHGTFVGTATGSEAKGLITTFGLSGPSGQALSGGAYLERPTP